MYENESLIKNMMNSKTKEHFNRDRGRNTKYYCTDIKHLIILNCERLHNDEEIFILWKCVAWHLIFFRELHGLKYTEPNNLLLIFLVHVRKHHCILYTSTHKHF